MGGKSSKAPVSGDNNKVAPDITESDLGSSDTLPELSKEAENRHRQPHCETDDVSEDFSKIPYEEYEYPFENLVFEGGGAKGQVYIGCLQILEELSIKPKRVAGASAGAICAALLAVGFNATEMKEILATDLEKILLDHSCGLCSLVPNLCRKFGWNPGNRFLKEMGKLIALKGYNPDVTFKQLYKKTGIELCVTAVNVNMLAVEYFHVKTTPNMEVRLAVRMSLSIPGIFQAVQVTNSRGQTDIYIDGGLVCNYPIHAFDGWWLSLKREDSFLNRIQPLSQLRKLMDKKERFGEYNEKTLGFVVYSALEQDLMQTELDHISGLDISDRPENSHLYKSRAHAYSHKQETLTDHKSFLKSLDKFLELVRAINRTDRLTEVLMELNSAKTSRGATPPPKTQVDDVIDKEELKQALKIAVTNSSKGASAESQFSARDVEILFGENASIDSVFDELDVDNSGCISYDELVLFIERAGIDIQSKFQGYDRKEMTSLCQYLIGLQDTLLTNVKKMFIEDRDIDRTIGINTDYIETSDFKMAVEDREFCYERGRKATVSFLRHYVYRHNPPKKGALQAIAQEVKHLEPSSISPPAHLAPKLDSSLPLPANLSIVGDGLVLPPIRGTAKTGAAEKPRPPGYVVRTPDHTLRHDSPATASAITTETKAPATQDRGHSSCSAYSSDSR